MPSESEIKLGFSCNNNCIFCLNADKRHFADLPTEKIKERILLARKNGCSKIILTGGEPAIRQDFYELCKFVRNNGLQLEIHTNARMFSYRDFAEKISKLGIGSFLVSLHAHNSKLGDFLSRSKGSFEQAVHGIKNLVGMGNNVKANIVINNYNLKNLGNIVKLAEKLNAGRIQLTWPEPMGNALHNFSDVIPKFSDAAAFIKPLLSKKIRVAGMPLCVLGKKYRKFFLCYLKKMDFEIDRVWDSSDINSLKTTKPEKCGKCAEKNSCFGVYREYLKRYGDGELKPIKKLPLYVS